MKKTEYAKAHPGFKAVSEQIAKKEGVSVKTASRILAVSSRAHAAGHPHLQKVKG